MRHHPVDQAVEVIRAGGLVVIPTDTVYGLCCDVTDPEAIGAIFRIKGRPSSKPLPVLGADPGALTSVAAFDRRAELVGRVFWPGPLTIVLPRAPGFEADLGGSGDATVAVRVPAADVALQLLARTGPLAVTSANLSGEPPAASVEEARAALGDDVGAYLDGGPAEGQPSTVVSLVGEMQVLRDGPISRAELTQTLTS